MLLLSAYRSASHAAWTDWLTTSLETIDWQIRELPGRHFRWRIRGNPISWLNDLPPVMPVAVIATSMVDLATLRGLHPNLAGAPALYYFHENQFAYPVGEQQASSVDPQMVQLYGALAADRLAFNSAYNRDSFLEGVGGLLRRMPDRVPAGIVDRLAARAEVLPVIVADGKLSREQYETVLGRAGIAVSTALHEFQGLAMLEAASAGVRPLVPDDLSYPEQYPARYRYPPGDGAALVERLHAWLDVGLPPALNVSAWSVDALQPAWAAAVQDLINIA
ncbi:MAG: DUF3524 domain-containing protein [Thioalkalivibrio sp.]|nr:DUF3524 domain-containing protein [Thioalkalivibrio sp.]